MANALAAIAAAHHVGIPIANAVESLATFKSVKRRMEVICDQADVRVFDDFAHHPTAIAETLAGLRRSVGKEKIIAVLEPRSNTMKRGVHKHLLKDALQHANNVLVFADENVKWDISELDSDSIHSFSDTGMLLEQLTTLINDDNGRTNVLIMSNGAFDNLYQRLIDRLVSGA